MTGPETVECHVSSGKCNKECSYWSSELGDRYSWYYLFSGGGVGEGEEGGGVHILGVGVCMVSGHSL